MLLKNMDRSSLRKYAVWAHDEWFGLISRTARAYHLDTHSIKDGCGDDVQPLTPQETSWRDKIALKMAQIGYHRTVEEIASLWFCRCCALYYMEATGFLPLNVSVFFDQQSHTNAQLSLFEYHDQMQKQLRFRDHLISVCHRLERYFPELFGNCSAEAELLLPADLSVDNDVFERMRTAIPRNALSKCGEVEIVGWLYQYFISQRHDEVVDPLYGKAIDKSDIPVATQVWTPDWVVQFITDNSLGRYLLEQNPGSKVKRKLRYLVPFESCESQAKSVDPACIKVIDPCAGAGHFLVYAFDVLMHFYIDAGYKPADAVRHILAQNLVGLDIDEHVVAIARFALMMKACAYDKSVLNDDESPVPRVFAVHSDAWITSEDLENASFNRHCVKQPFEQIRKIFANADEFGSLLRPERLDLPQEWMNADNSVANKLKRFAQITEILNEQYDVVITNPPYLNKYNDVLKKFIKSHYADCSADLFGAFIHRCLEFAKPGGYAGLMTPNVWMFIQSYEALRKYIVEKNSITTLIQMAKGAFFDDATVDVCAFVIEKDAPEKQGVYFRLESFRGNMDVQKERILHALKTPDCDYVFRTLSQNYRHLPGTIIAYWISRKMMDCFTNGRRLELETSPRQGLATTDNARFLRHWFEIDFSKIGFGFEREQAITSNYRWFPYNKGGLFRKWYGNQDYIVDYWHDGEAIKASVMRKYPYLKTPGFVVKNPGTYFSPSLSWSKISSGNVAFRFYPKGFLYDVSGCSIFYSNDAQMYYHAGFLNSIVCRKLLEMISPTVNYEAGHIAVLPIIHSDVYLPRICELVAQNIDLSKADWDDFEVSWAFKKHPLAQCDDLQKSWLQWEQQCDQRFEQVKSNETELNRMYIEIYGLQDEIVPDVPDREVTVRRADMKRDAESLISYGVGCLFGRYSLDMDGLVNTGEPLDMARYKRFAPVSDNILYIGEEDGMENDIAERFAAFIEAAYGSAGRDANLNWIAGALDNKGDAMQVIRHYLVQQFYANHLKMYQKRPIYWLFDSGSEHAFQCLIYMHRYRPQTIGRIRSHYLARVQRIYSDRIAAAKLQQQNISAADVKKIAQQIDGLERKYNELAAYENRLKRIEAQEITLNLEDGVKVNYEKLSDVLAIIK